MARGHAAGHTAQADGDRGWAEAHGGPLAQAEAEPEAEAEGERRPSVACSGAGPVPAGAHRCGRGEASCQSTPCEPERSAFWTLLVHCRCMRTTRVRSPAGVRCWGRGDAGQQGTPCKPERRETFLTWFMCANHVQVYVLATASGASDRARLNNHSEDVQTRLECVSSCTGPERCDGNCVPWRCRLHQGAALPGTRLGARMSLRKRQNAIR